MAKRPSTMETVRLSIELLRRIPRGRDVTAKKLHEELTAEGFTRDLRTIQRLLDTLSEHFGIERNMRDKPYGYRWKALEGALSLTSMSEQEALLLALAHQHLQYLLPAHVAKSMEGFFTEAQRSLGPDRNAKLQREWLRKVKVVSTTQPLLPATIRPGVMEEVSNALYRNLWLEIDYKNVEGKRTTAEVMPLGMAQQGPSLSLVCRFLGFDDDRRLTMHRMLSAKATIRPFKRPEDFDLAKFDDDGRFGISEGKRIRVQFDIDKSAGQHLLETRLSTDQLVKDLGKAYRITATVVESEFLRKWLLGLGDAVSRVAPARLVAHAHLGQAGKTSHRPAGVQAARVR